MNQLVSGIINPLIGKLVGSVNLSDYKIVLTEATEDTAECAVMYGVFIQAIINFIIVAFCVFCVVRSINKAKEALEKLEAEKKKKEEAEEEAVEEEAPEEPSEEILLLREIRDSLKKEEK